MIAIFAIVAYFKFRGTQMQSVVETLVAIFLPLSSIWASANNNARLRAANRVPLLAIPEYRPSVPINTADSGATLVDPINEGIDGLRPDERQYRSRYDMPGSPSIDNIAGQARDVDADTTGEGDDGLYPDERQYRSRYDMPSTISVDHIGGQARDVELQSLGGRGTTSLGRVL